jgi:hypothetical protein
LLLRAVSNFFSIFASFTRFAVVMKSLKNLCCRNLELKSETRSVQTLLCAERHSQMLQ